MQSRFRSRHKAGFGAAGLGTAQSWFWSRHKASFTYIFFMYISYIYIYHIYAYINKRIYIKKRHISRKYIYIFTYTQSLVLDTKRVLYWPVLEQIQFCSFDRRCKTCLDTKQVLYQSRFCNLTQHKAGLGAGTKPVLERLVYHRRLAGFGAAGLAQAQSRFWSRHKASFGAVSRPN